MGRTRSTNRGLILLLQIMTPYIQQQLKKLCDNPNWYDDMLISWDKNPRNQREAIYTCTTKWVTRKHSDSFYIHRWRHAFYFEIPRDTNRYLILGILDEAGLFSLLPISPNQNQRDNIQ